MKARTGLIVQEINTLLADLFAKHKTLGYQDVLAAIEFIRHTITEQAIRRGQVKNVPPLPRTK